MEDVQTNSVYFFAPVAAAYLFACLAWYIATRTWPRLWRPQPEPRTHRPWLDLTLVFLAALAVLGIGQLYRAGYLIPRANNDYLGALIWTANNVIVFSPIAIVLWLRKQGLETVYLSPTGLARKIMVGLVLAAASVVLFLTLRWELDRLPAIAYRAFTIDALENFFPVFLEGVALAFAFVRLRWAIGLVPALVLPSLLFAMAHIPGSLASDRPWDYILAFFLFNGTLTAAILYVVHRSRDIVWLGIVHYFMDVAINAF